MTGPENNIIESGIHCSVRDKNGKILWEPPTGITAYGGMGPTSAPESNSGETNAAETEFNIFTSPTAMYIILFPVVLFILTTLMGVTICFLQLSSIDNDFAAQIEKGRKNQYRDFSFSFLPSLPYSIDDFHSLSSSPLASAKGGLASEGRQAKAGKRRLEKEGRLNAALKTQKSSQNNKVELVRDVLRPSSFLFSFFLLPVSPFATTGVFTYPPHVSAKNRERTLA